jgi:hypothetical protein
MWTLVLKNGYLGKWNRNKRVRCKFNNIYIKKFGLPDAQGRDAAEPPPPAP